MESVIPSSGVVGRASFEPDGFPKAIAKKTAYTSIWTVLKIVHFIKANSTHILLLFRYRIFGTPIPRLVVFERPAVGVLSARQLGLSHMWSSYVSFFGLVKGVDEVGRAILWGSSREVHTTTRFDRLVEEFQQLGGRINHCTTFDLAGRQISGVRELPEFTKETKVAPGCEFGRNRSRMAGMLAVRRGVPTSRLYRPHGGTSGFDALHDFDAHEWVTAASCGLDYILGARRGDHLKRNGMEETDGLTAPQRRQWMEDHYFGPMIQEENGVVAVLFDHCIHAFLLRMVHLAKRDNARLNHVTIAPICAEDPCYMLSSAKVGFERCMEEFFGVQTLEV